MDRFGGALWKKVSTSRSQFLWLVFSPFRIPSSSSPPSSSWPDLPLSYTFVRQQQYLLCSVISILHLETNMYFHTSYHYYAPHTPKTATLPALTTSTAKNKAVPWRKCERYHVWTSRQNFSNFSSGEFELKFYFYLKLMQTEQIWLYRARGISKILHTK